ncbi:MAG TPA: aminoglycoside adenylyltransferase domain-containing protein [Candidatus Eisenbacteria bacterium]|jgi:hypothetical protein
MSAIPPPVAGTLRALTDALRELLAASLVGVYLHGSLTQRAFDPASSDVDCVVVVRRDLTDARFRKLRTWLARAGRSDPWMPRVQMQVLVRHRLLRPDTRGALYQFGVLKRSGSDGNPLIWLNVLASGITLAGPDPKTFLPPITKDLVSAALVREVGYLRREFADSASPWRGQPFYRIYAVLTLGRILYTHRKGGVVSKPRAARWALRALPPGRRSLVRDALAGARGIPTTLAVARITSFVRFVHGQLDRARGRAGRGRARGNAGFSGAKRTGTQVP